MDLDPLFIEPQVSGESEAKFGELYVRLTISAWLQMLIQMTKFVQFSVSLPLTKSLGAVCI